MESLHDVLCIGNATIDVFIILKDGQKINFDKFTNQLQFPMGEKIPLDKYIFSLGGNACNVSVGLSRLGFKSSLVAGIGNDDFSEIILKTLNKEKVDDKFISKENRTSPLFNIVISYFGERVILDAGGDKQIEINVPSLNPRLVYLTSIKGDWQKIFTEAFEKNNNSLFAINPGTRQIEDHPDLIKSFLPKTEVLFLNVSETQKITNDSNPDIKKLLENLKKLGAKINIITDGINGSYSIDKSGNMLQLGVINTEKPLERTGAGDSYAAGFLYGMLNGKSIEECMKLGTINANSVIFQIGAQNGLLDKNSIEIEFNNQNNFQALKI